MADIHQKGSVKVQNSHIYNTKGDATMITQM